MIYVELGEYDEAGGSIKNLDAFKRLHDNFSDAIFLVGYDSKKVPLEQLLQQYRSDRVRFIRLPAKPVIAERVSRVWEADREGRGATQVIRLETLRGKIPEEQLQLISSTAPKELEELLSTHFEFAGGKEPEVVYRAEGIHSGATCGKVYTKLEDAVEARKATIALAAENAV